jgi:acyl carrier protein
MGVAEKVNSIIVEQLGVDVDQVTPEIQYIEEQAKAES